MAGDRAVHVVGVQPLHCLGRVAHDRRRLAELDRQGFDDFDLALGQPDEHRGQLDESPRAGLHPHAFAALAGVVELELMLLGDRLLWQGGGGRRRRDGRPGLGARFALKEIERHGDQPRDA